MMMSRYKIIFKTVVIWLIVIAFGFFSYWRIETYLHAYDNDELILNAKIKDVINEVRNDKSKLTGRQIANLMEAQLDNAYMEGKINFLHKYLIIFLTLGCISTLFLVGVDAYYRMQRLSVRTDLT